VCCCSTALLWAQLLGQRSAGLLIIFGTVPVLGSPSRSGVSICQFGGPSPVERLGVSFLVSPVVQELGIGTFGMNFGWDVAVRLMKKCDVSHHCRDCTKMISSEEVFRGILYLVDVAGAGTTPL
jgi:hypothetical protein